LAKKGASMICPELVKHAYVDQERYRLLSPAGRNLIFHWFEQARRMKDHQGTACFEAFFCTWLAFNGWAACVTDEDQDAEYIDALKRDIQLCQNFTAFIQDETSPLAIASVEFANFWPIFDVRDLRRRNLRASGANREDTIQYYLEHGARSFAPKCGKKHRDAGQPLPIDWPHTLSALYQVRCNFFHGGKMLDSEEDQRIIVAANKTLLSFLEQGRYIE
jgi:hypothetical protein